MKHIDKKYKIPLVGKYNKGIYSCLDCNTKLLFNDKLGTTFDNMIGFSESRIGNVCIVECPVCFEKWFYHISYGDIDTYSYFLDSVEMGKNKHFKNKK